MIKSFKCKKTEELYRKGCSQYFKTIERQAMKKLFMLASAEKLNDLRVPPGNRLEALKGNRINQYSIRINDQYRLCFNWNDGSENVEITDYH
ncbi:MAG: plasmid maintenance system killer protein [Lentisphaerae bacterium GWF2_44_16]|nr:MAG: plasmid maintenance system killer protein [Lentisphaerae bacterium GWF2_44_16]